MGELPFTEEQFFEVFAAYNQAFWPAPLILSIVGVGVAVLIWIRRDGAGRWAAAFLAALWLWTGVAYHLLHFTSVNPAARLFGALFVVQAVLFLWWGVVRGGVTFVGPRGLRGALAGLFLVYALAVYPIIGVLSGHGFMTGPTFGAPCPAVIYTFGLLMLVRMPPPWLLAIPILWAVLGSSAVVAFHVWQDAGLLLSALAAVGLLIRERRRSLPRGVSDPPPPSAHTAH